MSLSNIIAAWPNLSFKFDFILRMEDVCDYSAVFGIVQVAQGNLSGRLCGHLSGHGAHDPAAEVVGAFTPNLPLSFEGSVEAAYLTNVRPSRAAALCEGWSCKDFPSAVQEDAPLIKGG